MKQHAVNHLTTGWASSTDDLSALSRLVSLPELAYQDIGQQQQLVQIVARWPLLAELSLGAEDDLNPTQLAVDPLAKSEPR